MMQTVKFAKTYRHKIDALREARYPAGAEMEVSNEVAAAAEKAGALEKGPKNGGRPAPANRTGSNDQPES
ncbi:hypothetical protein SLG_22120 [Sphingobium sp. SYK-6]|uniref:hypothetical protein n=1 Tax=Sphingobium sp. (strain NBRC 103272 / SYK-6) TaxID=627192 RepID=UPI0002277133|nr:hypothetical protein [Sphingobium sp. SYK-6]BAK66887.1 hypothetical protein SLG_22120 [Sphingobium sp. SYK-6]